MRFGSDDRFDEDDMFADTRMSFGDHIEVLRTHLFKAIAGFVIALLISFWFGKPVMDFIARPVERELMQVYQRRIEGAKKKFEDGNEQLINLNKPTQIHMGVRRGDLARIVGVEPKGGEDDWVDLPMQVMPTELVLATAQANQAVNRPPMLAALSVTEGFVIYMKVCVYLGIVLASPWIFYQLWSFVAAGLYPQEKRLVNVYLPISLGLFLIGVLVAEFIVIPKAVEYLLAFNEWLDLEPDLRLSEWLSFALLMPLVFGIAFQTPLVMLFLNQLGIVDVSLYRKHRRIAWFGLAVLAMILAASPDAFSVMALIIPLWILYELGILFCVWLPRTTAGDEVPESEEMIEV